MEILEVDTIKQANKWKKKNSYKYLGILETDTLKQVNK